MSTDVQQEVERLGISRLCHFTPLRNLVHITTGEGLLSTQILNERERKEFTQQDLARWDGHPDHISCSIEYPNAWYYRRKLDDDDVFRTWVVLTIHPSHLGNDETLFCHRNASAAYGTYIRTGIEGLRGLYETPVVGAGNRTYERTPNHLAQCPTDNQAEVLVPRFIPIEDVLTVAVPTDEQAAFVYTGLEQIGGAPERFSFTVVPEFFAPWSLKHAISGGMRPAERLWTP